MAQMIPLGLSRQPCRGTFQQASASERDALGTLSLAGRLNCRTHREQIAARAIERIQGVRPFAGCDPDGL